MFITSITTGIQKLDRYGSIKKGTRTTNVGKLPNGNSITIEVDKFNNKITEKTYIIWNDVMQRIIVKGRKGTSQRFERIG